MAEFYGEQYDADAQTWAMIELGHTDVGDRRRTLRLVRLVAALVHRPASSLPGACGTWAATKAAYRFLDNEDVEPEAVLSGHRQSTLKRAGEHPLILAVQDTTAYNFSSHRATRGLGPIGKRSGNSPPTGFFMHSSLAVTPEGVPLGLLAHKLWVRPEAEGETEAEGDSAQPNSPGEDKESVRWEELLRSSTEGIPAGTQVVTVADREADIYDFLFTAQQLHQHVLVRACYNRRLHGTPDQLWDALEQAPVVGHMVIEVPRADDRPSRTATLELRTARVTLREPSSARTRDATLLKPYAVLAREIDPPEGQEAIEWRLLTTLPVTSAEDACTCVRWYTHRWKIERYHYTLKSGCQVEELQLETVDRLHRALAVYSVVAWRLLYLTYMARTEPDAPCTSCLSNAEWQALYCQVHRTRHVPEHPPTLKTAVLWIARLGGFLARKRDGNPGVQVLWRGYRRLQDMVIMWNVLQSDE